MMFVVLEKSSLSTNSFHALRTEKNEVCLREES